ncbi:CD2 antigen cytoplasmic tail-binding protein 2 homolog [Caerostris extrusa]|uniref:CD2 antigen cytoplasmic tail-binding protein 2 homolog n=1 Tax=Caerostris extrusa TaxID=172846 RepID=A0AAV4T059_CAEEX|nr:CD2 antigen cytoplasmic tail-binding protein 2 homolog [Caerostris extrusa]
MNKDGLLLLSPRLRKKLKSLFCIKRIEEVFNVLYLISKMDGNLKPSQIFNQEELEAEIQREKDDRIEALSYKKSKHSLDSDEEDEDVKAEKYNILDPNEFEGQEDRTIDFDGEIKITPFNMKEELEEGYFDKEGTYIFKKEDEIKDQWLDDIDWVKIKAVEASKRKQDEDSNSEDERPPIDLVAKYTQMLELMKPGESVQRAICRLGGNKSSRSASSRWKKKKESNNMNTNEENEKDVEKLQLLTSLADDIVHSGDMDIYQQTYEKMTFYVNSKSGKSGPNGSLNTNAELDMFGDDFEEKVDENKPSLPDRQTPSPSTGVGDTESEVMWEFKWEDKEDDKIYGPYPTSQMQQWVDEKYFENGVFVRQVGKQDAAFYSSKRIDFELYL